MNDDMYRELLISQQMVPLFTRKYADVQKKSVELCVRVSSCTRLRD